MKTVIVDLLKDEAINLLKDLEALDIVRLHEKDKNGKVPADLAAKYSGAMSQRQSIEEIDRQLKELRDEWD
ncbi:MAG TPA: hypothetical protein VIM55_18940 [Mucilaginibacter sp.]